MVRPLSNDTMMVVEEKERGSEEVDLCATLAHFLKC